MNGVNLVSGGLDSTLVALILKSKGISQIPLFVNYGQLAHEKEWETCAELFSEYELPTPEYLDIRDFGRLIPSGITSEELDIHDDAFLPGRNLLLLVVGASVSYRDNGHYVSMGILSEDYSIYPDQRSIFIASAESSIRLALGSDIKILLPLFDFSKRDVLSLAEEYGIDSARAYYCHKGSEEPCNECISCRERMNAEDQR